MVGLDAPYHTPRHPGRQQGILRIIFKVPAAQGTSVDIHRRRQPCTDIVLLYFRTASLSHPLRQLRVPGTCQQRSAGPGGGAYAALGCNPQTGRPVRRHDIGNAVLRQIAVTEGIGHPCVRLSPQQPGQIPVG